MKPTLGTIRRLNALLGGNDLTEDEAAAFLRRRETLGLHRFIARIINAAKMKAGNIQDPLERLIANIRISGFAGKDFPLYPLDGRKDGEFDGVRFEMALAYAQAGKTVAAENYADTICDGRLEALAFTEAMKINKRVSFARYGISPWSDFSSNPKDMLDLEACVSYAEGRNPDYILLVRNIAICERAPVEVSLRAFYEAIRLTRKAGGDVENMMGDFTASDLRRGDNETARFWYFRALAVTASVSLDCRSAVSKRILELRDLDHRAIVLLDLLESCFEPFVSQAEDAVRQLNPSKSLTQDLYVRLAEICTSKKTARFPEWLRTSKDVSSPAKVKIFASIAVESGLMSDLDLADEAVKKVRAACADDISAILDLARTVRMFLEKIKKKRQTEKESKAREAMVEKTSSPVKLAE